MVWVLIVLALICQKCTADDATSLERALIAINGSLDNVLPFALGGEFAKFGKFLKFHVSPKQSDAFERELIRIYVRLNKLKNLVLASEPEVKKEIDTLRLLENVEPPLIERWKTMLNFLSSPTEPRWTEFIQNCYLEDPTFFMKRLRLNVKHSLPRMERRIRHGNLTKKRMEKMRAAIAKQMFLTISLMHLCGAAVHGSKFDAVTDENVDYMRKMHPYILNELSPQKVYSKLRTPTGTDKWLLKLHAHKNINSTLDAINEKMETVGETEDSKKNNSSLASTDTDNKDLTDNESQGIVIKVAATAFLNAVKLGEYIAPDPFGKALGALGFGLSKIGPISELDMLDETNDVLEKLDKIQEQLYEISVSLANLEKKIEDGNRRILNRIANLQLNQDVSMPLNVMIDGLNTLSQYPNEEAKNRVYLHCRDDLPRTLMSRLSTYTKSESEHLREDVPKWYFDENDVKHLIEKRIQTMQIIVTMHYLCRGMLLGNSFDSESDVEVAHVKRHFEVIASFMKNTSTWRRDNFFTHPAGVDGVVRDCAKQVSPKDSHSHLSDMIRNKLQRHYPSYEWIVLVWNGQSAMDRSDDKRYSSLRCHPNARRYLKVDGERRVAVVRAVRNYKSCDNGCVTHQTRTDKYWPTKKGVCPVSTFFGFTTCHDWMDPRATFSLQYCSILVEEKEAVGVSGTSHSYSTRDSGGMSVCHFDCWTDTFLLMVRDPQLKNIA